MARNNQTKALCPPETLGEADLKKWEVKDLVPLLMDAKAKIKKQTTKITKLEEVISEHTDPGDRLISGLAETGVATGAAFLNPFLVSMLGADWQKLKITDDFGIDSEAITAGALYAAGLGLFWTDMFYGKWFFEAGKGAVTSYAGHIGRTVGTRLALAA